MDGQNCPESHMVTVFDGLKALQEMTKLLDIFQLNICLG
jgi:hypothetical protein